MYTAISLFSGAVDGLAIAAQSAGITVTHHVEWDAWCCRVLRMNHPDSIVLNKDIHDVHELPPADIIFGGSPCQEFSVAGSGKGFSGERYLWPEMLRIVRANHPRVVIHENVRGGVSKGLLDRISDDLESEGYETTALVFPACVFGAPHERYRMFHIGLLADTSPQRRPQQRAESNTSSDQQWDVEASEQSWRTVANAFESSGQDVAYTKHNGHTTTTLTRGNDETVHNLSQGQDSASEFEGSDTPRVTSTNALEHTHSDRMEANDHESSRDQQEQYYIRPNSNWDFNRLSQSSVGGTPIRSTARIPRLNPVTDFPGFPAGQGIYQHPYEPPRTTAQKGEYAKERIQALGNAVVWQQAAPIFRAVMRWLKTQDKQP